VKLYCCNDTCSLAAHIALREAGLPCALVKVDLATKRTETGADYRALYPKGYVPALQLDDGQVIGEVPAVLQYIADQAPMSGIAPANGSVARYQLQEWLNFIGTELHMGFMPLFYPDVPPEAEAGLKERQHRRLDARLGWVAAELDQRPYLLGEHISVADFYLFTVLGWGKPAQVDIARWPALTRYRERIAARPHVRAALESEGIV